MKTKAIIPILMAFFFGKKLIPARFEEIEIKNPKRKIINPLLVPLDSNPKNVIINVITNNLLNDFF